MKKTVYLCDGCGKQDDERTKRVKRGGYYRSYYSTQLVAPEGWSRVVVNRKGFDICSSECAIKAIDRAEKAAIEKAEAKAKAEKEKVRKQAEKARAKANGTTTKKGARS